MNAAIGGWALGVYCGVDAHDRCATPRCSCPCHHERGAAVVVESVECPYCARRCGSGPGLASHIRSMHPEHARAADPLPARPAVPPPARPADQTPPRSDDDGLVWEEPPAYRKSFGDIFGPKVVALKRRPGEWARVHEYPKPSSAQGSTAKLRKLFPDIQWRAAKHGSGSAIWARYVEPEEG